MDSADRAVPDSSKATRSYADGGTLAIARKKHNLIMWSIFKSPRVTQAAVRQGPAEYRLGRRFDPGAMAEVFEPLLGLPAVMFRGAARLAGQFGTVQPPQVFVRQHIPVAGIGGVQAGQYVGQPLIDPSQLEPEGG